MSNDHDDGREERMARQAKRLGTWNFACITCGNSCNPAALEYSHIAPRHFHDDGGPQCRNCHAEFSDEARGLPYKPQSGNPHMETIARYFLALSEWLKRIAETIAAFGAWLMGLASALPAGAEEAAQ